MQADKLKLRLDAEESLRSRSLTSRALSRLWRDRLSTTAIAVLLILTAAAIAAPLITGLLGVDPNTTDASGSKYLPVFSEGHLLGTDNLGRDHLARLLYAGQVSLFIGFMSAFLALVIGVTLGIITGYYGGIIDDLVNWVITTLNAIPGLVLIDRHLGCFPARREFADFGHRILDLDSDNPAWFAARPWPSARANISSAQKPSARPTSASCRFTSFPNVFSLTIVTLARNIGIVMLIEASLSFLGLGVQPPTATWGNMLSKSREFITKQPHLMILPGLLITIVVLCPLCHRRWLARCLRPDRPGLSAALSRSQTCTA